MEHEQMDALQLADWCEGNRSVHGHSESVAKELRRLHARNQELESRRSADTAGALFDFAGYLTTLPAKAAFPVGSHHSAEPMVEALKAWAKTRALSLESADVVGWVEGKKTAPPAAAWEVSFTEREEFEAWWMLSPMTSNKRPARLPDGQYANSLADHAWNGWQGRAAATIDLTEGMLEKVAAPVVLPERVGRIGHGFALLYRADKPIHQVVKEQGLKIGDDLFSAPQVCKLLARDLGGVNLDRLDKALIKLGYATWVSQAEAAANIPHWVNALTRCVLETPVAAPQPQADCLRETAELKRLSACCPELNMNNYGHDDVDELNSWAIEVSQYIDRAICQPQEDALDAERWRFIKRKLCLSGNGDGTCAMQALNLPARILGWPDVGELAIAQFLDEAIDAAIAAAKENT